MVLQKAKDIPFQAGEWQVDDNKLLPAMFSAGVDRT
jgi:hypothetical protein